MDYVISSGSPIECFPDASLGRIFYDALKKRQDEVFMVDGLTKESITCIEILRKSVKIAKALKKLGIKQNDVVSVVHGNTLDYIIYVLASTFIGAIVHLINPNYKMRELKAAFNISTPKLIFTSESCLKAIQIIQNEVDYIKEIVCESDETLTLNDLIKMGDDGDDINNFTLTTFNNDEQVALIMSSSGTTGLPKGVMLTHSNIRYSLNYLGAPYGLNVTSNDATIIMLPFFHIFGLLLVFGALFGLQLVLLKTFKPDTYLKIIEQYKITKLYIVPTLATFLAKSDMTDNFDLTSLTEMLCAGAPLGYEIEMILKKKFNVITRQAYGLTETSGAAILSPPEGNTVSGSSGVVIKGTDIKVIDIESHKPLGPNKIGEILTKSEQNMKCYMKDEKATKAVFDKYGFLHTGDIGYYNEDGFFFIVDRLKELIKYKGFQVPPAELEEILVSHKDILEAAVVGIPDERAGELPKAYIVKQPLSKITEEEIVDFIADNVSIEKRLYGGVEFIDQIPKGPTGKMLRRILRERNIIKV